MKYLLSVICCLALLLSACKQTKEVIYEAPVVEVEERQLDTLMVSASKPDRLKEPQEFKLPPYNASHRRYNDLLHTRLDLSFDWDKQRVMGKASLKVKPHFYPVDELELDAKGFDIHSVKMAGPGLPLSYKYDDEKLIIELGRVYKSTETYTVQIDYTAKPAETGGEGGSAAITSDQGLFFINHDGSNPDKPQQIWTQGETEWNSRWFPTIDKPNERCTQEMYLTVADKYTTLSNGVLVSSTKNDNGTRTDYWKMDKPHAPYLFMLTVGEYAKVSEQWKDLSVDYYVEPKFEEHAKAIFPNTVEMLEYFSGKLNYEFPWSKYSQIIVRDYVSGAMENTTSSIFGEFIQMTERELIDNTINEMIVAHELFHHWFGDLVTCESWANLTMNEGFADYSEYLWFEHKHGTDFADYHRFTQMAGYFGQTSQGDAHPLIHFGYTDKEDMFDAHSYNKGGLVLHMLRNYVGDDAFWASLNKYLTDNEYESVEAHNLRLAFEKVTGRDLNWFFNQWFFSTGHPILDISTAYNDSTKQVQLTVQQTQDPDRGYPAIFVLPASVDIYTADGQKTRHKIEINERVQTFAFDAQEAPSLVNFDSERILLAEIAFEKTADELAFQLKHAPKFFDRFEAIQGLQNFPGQLTVSAKTALADPFWAVRKQGVEAADIDDPQVKAQIEELVKSDSHSEVRSTALALLASTQDAKYIDVAKKVIETDQALPVVALGLQALSTLDESSAMEYAAKLEGQNYSQLLAAIAEVYASKPESANRSFFEKNFENVDGYDAIAFFEQYSKVLQSADIPEAQKAAQQLNKLALNQRSSPWKRFSATKTMHELRQHYRNQANFSSDTAEKTSLEEAASMITDMINGVKEVETNNQLKMIYNNF
ncbi:MAG: M1 family metallopeptidase [Bacteroidota bacterium]